MKLEMSSPKPLKTQAYDILKKAIIGGIFKDKDLISERIVYEKFRISRTPFREVIPTLEAEGWVKSIPYKGTYVNPITLKDIHEVFELRMIVEPAVARHVQNNLTDDSLIKMENILNSMKADSSEQSDYEFMELDRDFHKALYEMTNNSRLIMAADQVSDLMQRIGIRVLNKDSRRQEAIEEHREIMNAFKLGNAEEAVLKHLEKTKEIFIELYKQ